MPLDNVPYVSYVDENLNPIGRILVEAVYQRGGNRQPQASNNAGKRQEVYYEPNLPFTATFRVTRVVKGKYIVFDSETNSQYSISVGEMFKVFSTHEVVGGVVSGRWIVAKIGPTNSLRLIEGIKYA